jgi:hypothetical protein
MTVFCDGIVRNNRPNACAKKVSGLGRWYYYRRAYFDKVTLTEMSLCEFAADGHGYRMRTATAKPRAVRTARSCRFA